MKSILFFLALIFATSLNPLYAREPIVGNWTTEEAKSTVEIFKCGENYCGRIVSLKEPNYVDSKEGALGTPKQDKNNPERTLRKRPVIGLQIMEGFSQTGSDSWGNGRIYDPENGKTYSCKIRLVNSNRLDVRGFIGISLLGRTSSWTR